MKQERWRSKVAWASLFSLIVLVLKQFFDVEVDRADELIDLLLLVFTGFGVFNNPTNKTGY